VLELDVVAEGDADAQMQVAMPLPEVTELSIAQMRTELLSIRGLLTV
jgi:hypothetical protein